MGTALLDASSTEMMQDFHPPLLLTQTRMLSIGSESTYFTVLCAYKYCMV